MKQKKMGHKAVET